MNAGTMDHTLPNVLYRGSVKNVRGQKGGDSYLFEFSDRYSVFDWGEMPDALTGKGESLAVMAEIFFSLLGKKETWQNWRPAGNLPHGGEGLLQGWENLLAQLQAKGLSHHSLGLVDSTLNKLGPGHSSRLLKVKAIDVERPKALTGEDGKIRWDYRAYQEKRGNRLVPLEVIFRFGLPKGSSLLKRIHDTAYRSELGLTDIPQEGARFASPVLEFSTKLEPTDRYLPYEEAQWAAGLSQAEFKKLYTLSFLVSLRLRDFFSELELELWDGKLEFAFAESLPGQIPGQERDYMLVDAVGPDELRIMKEGVQLSKEILRQAYVKAPWYSSLDKAKKLAHERGIEDWQKLCVEELGQEPAPLPPDLKETVEGVYRELANLLALKVWGRQVFPTKVPLSTLLEGLRLRQ